MPQDILDAINNPETKETLQVARLIGRDLLASAFVEFGLDIASAQAAADQTSRKVSDQILRNETYDGDIARLVEILDENLKRLSERGEAMQAAIEAAALIVADDKQLQGKITDARAIGTVVIFGLCLVLGVAKLEGRYDWKTREGYIALQPGIPAGFAEIVESISRAVSDLSRQRPEERSGPGGSGHGSQPLDHAGGRTGAPPARIDNRTEPTGQRLPAPPARPRKGTTLSRQSALSLAQEIEAEFYATEAIQDIVGLPDGDLYITSTDILTGGRTSPGPSASERPRITIGTGIVPRGQSGFGITIRIQAPRYLKTKIYKRISALYRDAQDAVAEVRWIGPVELAASNPMGDWQRWVGLSRHLTIGSPINVAGGCVGAVGLFLSRADGYFVYTAGHCLADDHANPVGQPVYFTPQPSTPDPAKSIGTVERVDNPPRVTLLPTLAAVDPLDVVFDHGLVRLEIGHVPPRDRRLNTGGRTFATSVYEIDPIADSLARAVKSAARTKEGFGTITSFDTTVEAIDHIRGGAVRIKKAIEIEFDKPDAILPGDSGALVCLDRNGTLHPFGICVAGARRTKIRDPHGPAKSAAYVIPLSMSLKQLGDLEIY